MEDYKIKTIEILFLFLNYSSCHFQHLILTYASLIFALNEVKSSAIFSKNFQAELQWKNFKTCETVCAHLTMFSALVADSLSHVQKTAVIKRKSQKAFTSSAF